MDEIQIKLEQYKMYLQSKERFIDRSFGVNKFFLILNVVLLVLMIVFNDFTYSSNMTAGLVFSAVGAVSTLLYLGNIDAYSVLIKVKHKNVIDELEKQFPLQMHAMEKQGIDEWKEHTKSFFFSDLQKIMAYLFLLIYVVIFLKEVVPFIMITIKQL